MRKQKNHRPLELCFAAATGALIAVFIWLYLELTNVGVTIIWDRIPSYINFRHYTLVMCLAGGLVVGIFHHFYGPYPESMADAVRRVNDNGYYPFKNLPITVIAAFLSLFFGGAVGPESGLVCLLLGLCFWAMAQFGLARDTIQACLAEHPGASGGYMFLRMLKNLFCATSRLRDDVPPPQWKRSEQITMGMATGVTALIVYLLMNELFGSAFMIPHLDSGEIYIKDRISMILLAAAGIGSGYLFLIFRQLTSRFFGKLRTKKRIFSARFSAV